MNTVPAPIERAYADRLAGARRFKQAGSKVAGFVSTAVPVELIEAAGLHPVMVTGDSRADTALADVWMESMFDPMARAIFQSALSGDLEFLDVLIIPRTADSFLRLYLYLREIEKQGLCARLPRHIVLYDLLQTPSAASTEHNLAQLRNLGAILSNIAGRAIEREALRSAINASNINRRLLQALLTRRRADASIDGAATLKAITTRYLMPISEHTTALQAWMDSSPDRASVTTRRRVVVAGNAQDNEALHRFLVDAGLHIVGDYHWLGDSCAADIAIASGDDPWQALSSHYHRQLLSSRRFPHTPEELVAHAKQCGARGVVFYLFAAEEALTWDCPNQSRALENVGIAVLILENQPHSMTASAESTAKTAEFVKRLDEVHP